MLAAPVFFLASVFNVRTSSDCHARRLEFLAISLPFSWKNTPCFCSLMPLEQKHLNVAGSRLRKSGFVTSGLMEIVRKASITTLSNSGVQSEQLLFPENSSSRRVTITRVTVQPGSINPPHRHPASEQIWVALEGSGILLLDDERTEPFAAGDVVRFADGDLHGFRNPGDVPFIYLSVTAPPVNFREAYSKDWSKAGPARAAMQNRP
jgi:quercetin dioxygenase-like cupin family protein